MLAFQIPTPLRADLAQALWASPLPCDESQGTQWTHNPELLSLDPDTR